MKKLGLVLVIWAAAAMAQEAPTEAPKPQPKVAATNIVARERIPTYSDVYCAGFVTNLKVPETNYVAGGWATPEQVRYNDRQYIYLTGGGFQEGARYMIVRHVKDPNKREEFPGQRAAISAVGEPYADLGQVRIVGVQGSIGIAHVEFSCDTMVEGDIAIPYSERQIPKLAVNVPFDRFAPPNGKLTGRIVLAKDFDGIVSGGAKVYLNVGADQGVKVGDYFRVTRTYEAAKKDEVDYLSFKASYTEDTQKNEPAYPAADLNKLPRRSLAQLIVIDVTPKSATGLITFALEQVQMGDGVEMFDVPPPPPPAPPPAPMPPTISCTATPGSVRAGENVSINCQGASPDNRPLTYSYVADRGRVTPRDNTAVLDTTDASAGPLNVTSTVTDDRNLSASAMNTINVEAPAAAPTAQKLADINFKPNSAYVDNRAKAVLDDIALRLQKEADATAVVKGFAQPKEAKSLAMRRANNIKTYLTKSKGIDPGRITTTTGTAAANSAEVWIVPAGAQPPQ